MARVPGFVKWVLAPLAAGALGFYVVAPMFRGKVPLPKFVEKAASLARPRSEAAPEEAPQAPNVKVDVKPVPDEEQPRRRSDASDTAPYVVLPRIVSGFEA